MSRKNQAGVILVIMLIILAIPLLLIDMFAKALGWPITIIAIIAVIFLIIRHYNKKRAEWIESLYKKYKSEKIVNGILNKEYWSGQSSEQLIDSLGEPDCIDRIESKRRFKETWKYQCDGVNRYKLRIFLENGKVVGHKKRD